MPDTVIPFIPPVPDRAEAALAQAAALGRRDGLAGACRQFRLRQTRDGMVLLEDDQEQHRTWLPLAQSPVLLAALRHCYAAGHAHGADVRRENEARRRSGQAPIHLTPVA